MSQKMTSSTIYFAVETMTAALISTDELNKQKWCYLKHQTRHQTNSINYRKMFKVFKKVTIKSTSTFFLPH